MKLSLLKNTIVFSGLLSAQAFAASVEIHPQQIVVKLKDNSHFASSFGEELKPISRDGSVNLVKLPMGFHSENELEEIRKRPEVEWAFRDRIYHGDFRELMTNDPKVGEQDHHSIINSELLWDRGEGEQVVVAVTDDGYKMSHEDLEDAFFVNPNEIAGNGIDDDGNGYVDDVSGWDFNEKDNDPGSNWNHGSHGTHVAGIVGATTNNDIGVSGLGNNIRVMPLKFYGKNRWTSSMVLETYSYAVDNGAKIVTTSYNIDFLAKDPIYKEALSYVEERGAILFNSHGNARRYRPTRDQLDKILLVSATDTKEGKVDKKASFSNYGPGSDIAAPGVSILSTVVSGRYGRLSGTSMAAPLAAGVAAAIWSQYPDENSYQIAHRLMFATESITEKNSGMENDLGAGRVSFSNAFKESDIPLTFIKNVGRYNGMVEVTINGVLERDTNLEGMIQVFDEEGREIEVEALKKTYFLGGNNIQFKPKDFHRGKVKVLISDSGMRDAFGRGLDIDGNGQAGGELSATVDL